MSRSYTQKNGIAYKETLSSVSKKDFLIVVIVGSVRFRIVPNRYENSLSEWRFGREDLYGST